MDIQCFIVKHEDGFQAIVMMVIEAVPEME
jgi:hypothetical protein